MSKSVLRVRKGRIICDKHPRYQAKRMPTAKCAICWAIFSSVHVKEMRLKTAEEVLAK